MDNTTKNNQSSSDRVTLIISIIAIVISIIGCFFTYKANKKAEESNQIAKESNEIAKDAVDTTRFFVANEQRPYLKVRLTKFPDTEKYIQIFDGNDTTFKIRYELENVGNTPASKLTVPKTMMLGENLSNVLTKAEFRTLPESALAPTEKTFVIMTASFLNTKDWDISGYMDGKHGITIEIPFLYGDLFAPEKEYKTIVRNKIYINSAHRLYSMME